MGSLLAGLQAICGDCETLGAAGASVCESCGFRFAGSAPSPVAALPQPLRPPQEQAPAPQDFGDPFDFTPAGFLRPQPSPPFTPDAPTPAIGSVPIRASTPQAQPYPGGGVARGSAKLVLLRGLGESGLSFPLEDEVTTAGRTLGAIRFSADETLGPKAAIFVYRGGRIFIQDQGGPSGVFVRIHHKEPISQGDFFSLGDRLFRFGGSPSPFPPPKGEPTQYGSLLERDRPLVHLEMIHLGGIPGRSYLRPSPLSIGRVQGEVLVQDDPFVSSRHCQISVLPGGALLEDLGSSNGTFIRLPAGGERELFLGDTLRLGRNILRIEAR